MKQKLLISIFIGLLVCGCASTSTFSKYSKNESTIYLNRSKDRKLLSGNPLDEYPYLDITNKENLISLPNFIPTPLEESSRDIEYMIQEMDGIRVGVNIEMKCNDDIEYWPLMEHPKSSLPMNYQVKMFFENLLNEEVIINPSVYTLDQNRILNEPDINAFLSPLYRRADMEPVIVATGPAPKKPTIKYNSGTTKSGTIRDASGSTIATYTETKRTTAADALGNLNNILKYNQQVNKHRLQQSMTRMKVEMKEAAKNMAPKYIQYILNNWLKYEYRIPPRAKVASVVYLQNTDNITPITLNVKINDRLLEFESEEIENRFRWELGYWVSSKELFTFMHPIKVEWNERKNSLDLVYWDKRLRYKVWHPIMDLTTIDYRDKYNKIISWKISGTLDERYQTFLNIDNYIEPHIKAQNPQSQ